MGRVNLVLVQNWLRLEIPPTIMSVVILHFFFDRIFLIVKTASLRRTELVTCNEDSPLLLKAVKWWFYREGFLASNAPILVSSKSEFALGER